MERTSSGFYVIDVIPLHQASRRPFHLERRMRMKHKQKHQGRPSEGGGGGGGGTQQAAAAAPPHCVDQNTLMSPRSSRLEVDLSGVAVAAGGGGAGGGGGAVDRAGRLSSASYLPSPQSEVGASAAAALLAAELKRQRILEDRQGKLAKKYARVKQIMKTKQQERERKRKGLASSLKLAEKKRDAILQHQVRQCARAVQRAREVARRHTMQVDEETNRKRRLLETKIRASSARREKFLANERRLRSRAASEDRTMDSGSESQEDDVAMDVVVDDIRPRQQQQHDDRPPASAGERSRRAAVLIHRWYRHRKTYPLALEYRKHTEALDVDILRELPFQNVCALIQSQKVVRATSLLLQRAFKSKPHHPPVPPAAGAADRTKEKAHPKHAEAPSAKGEARTARPGAAKAAAAASSVPAPDQRYKTPARVFLSAYMIVSHTDSILMDVHKEILEKRLLVTAMSAIQTFEKWTSLVLKERGRGFSLSAVDAQSTGSPAAVSPTKRKFDQDEFVQPLAPKATTTYQAAQAFLNAWHTYHHAFTLWKQRDTMKLLNSMTRHFLQLDALWESIRDSSKQQASSASSAQSSGFSGGGGGTTTAHPAVESEWRPRIAKQRAEIKERVLKLGGPAALERMLAQQAEERKRRRAESSAESSEELDPQDPEDMRMSDADDEKPASAAAAAARAARGPGVGRQKVKLFDVNRSPMAGSVSSMPTRTSEAVPPTLVPVPFAGLTSPAHSTASPREATALLESLTVASPTKLHAASGAVLPADPLFPTAVPSVHKSTPQDFTISNEELAHELIMDPDFQLRSRQRTPAEEAARLKTMDDFFAVMKQDLSRGDMRRWLPGLLADLRDRLTDLTPDGGTIRRQVQEGLDQDLIHQQVIHGRVDLTKLFTFIVDIMKQICAPIRDEEIRKITYEEDPEMPVHERARKILAILDSMRLDLANFRLQGLRPHLKQMAVEYENSKFQESLDSGRASLRATTEWLREAVDAMKKVKKDRDPEGVGHPDADIRFEHVYVEALLGLLITHPSGAAAAAAAPPPSGLPGDLTPAQLSLKARLDRFARDRIPETLQLDRDRVISYSNEAHVLTLVSALVTMSRNLSAELRTPDTPTSKKMISTLLVLLRDNLAISVDSLTVQIISILESANQAGRQAKDGAAASEGKPKPVPEETRALVRSLVEKTVGGRDPVYKLIARRLSNTLRQFIINGGTMPGAAAIASAGLKPVEADLNGLARKIYALTRHNREVYAKWYDSIIRDAIDQG